MKTKTPLLLLLISISFFSCNSTVKNTAIPISDLDTDFPTSENLDFKFFNKYNTIIGDQYVIDDSILWSFKKNGADFGSCYSLNTGEKLSTIASRGRAANELTRLESFIITDDSVHFNTGRNTIKTFAKKDIITNVPMGNRLFSVIAAPDSILVYRMAKLPNGSVLATMQPALEEFQQSCNNEFNKKSVAIFNNKEATSYETINYESFDIEKATGEQLAANDLIKYNYASGDIGIKNNDMAVFSVSNQFILYTFDIKSGSVVNEKRYTNIQRLDEETAISTRNDKNLCANLIGTNDKYILCMVYSYLGEEGKEGKEGEKSELGKDVIFIFDWKLNPIKKIDLPKRENGGYIISNDCKSVYFCEDTDDGFILHKADLNL